MQDLAKNQKNTKSQNKISKIFEKSVDPGSLVFQNFIHVSLFLSFRIDVLSYAMSSTSYSL